MPEAFVDDRDFPYRTPELQPFSWIRTQTLGGRMVVPGHGWQYYRLPACDFQSADDDFSSWPITLEDLEPWYADVETLLGLSGSRDGLSCPPDGVIASVIHPDALEARMKDRIQARWPQANVILSRFASPAPCLDMAAATGRLTCRTGAVVTRILGARSGRADGVEWMDKRNADLHSARAPLVFLCASTIESARILMNSRTETDLAPGERSGCLGAFLTDRTIVRIEGTIRNTHHPYPPPPGRCLQLPRFDGRNGASGGRRGFGVQLYTYPSGNSSFFTAVAFIEGAPRASNRIRLRADPSGPEPSLEIDYSLSDVDHRLSREASKALRELADCLGAVTTHIDTAPSTPGLSIHECGTARMGADPSSSVLSPQNECWDMPGLFVTDGSAFPSQGSQNPALTIMALTARACRYALSQRAA
jgi:choline dehydrogenase-like flavoprotein